MGKGSRKKREGIGSSSHLKSPPAFQPFWRMRVSRCLCTSRGKNDDSIDRRTTTLERCGCFRHCGCDGGRQLGHEPFRVPVVQCEVAIQSVRLQQASAGRPASCRSPSTFLRHRNARVRPPIKALGDAVTSGTAYELANTEGTKVCRKL